MLNEGGYNNFCDFFLVFLRTFDIVNIYWAYFKFKDCSFKRSGFWKFELSLVHYLNMQQKHIISLHICMVGLVHFCYLESIRDILQNKHTHKRVSISLGRDQARPANILHILSGLL